MPKFHINQVLNSNGGLSCNEEQRLLTVHVEDIVIIGLAHRVGGHTAIRAVEGLVEVLNEQVRAGDHGVRRHVLVHP